MISHFCLLVLYKRDSTLHKTYIWWVQSTSQKRPPKMRRLCCRLRDVAWDRLSESRDVAKIRCGDLGKRTTPSLSLSRFSHLFLLHDCTIFEPGTCYLREVVAYESQRTGSDLAEEFQRHLLSEWEFIVYGMCISILSLKVLRMLCLSRYKTNNPIDHFYARDQWLCKFRGTKEGFFVRKFFNPHRIFWVRPHGRRFIVLHTNMAAVK